MSIEKTFTDSIAVSTKEGDGIYVGNKYGWRDITGQVNVRGVGANDPDWTQIGSGPMYAYKFALNDQCWFVYHVPHDIAVNPVRPIHFHVHWIPDGTNAQPVKWEWTYVYALGFDQAAFDMNLANSPLVNAGTITAETNGPGIAFQHIITETEGVTLPNLTEPDGLIYCRIRRVANGGTDNADGIFMLTSDIHYQSTNMATPGKEPWFYIG